VNEKIYIDRKKLKINQKEFEKIMKKDPGSAEILKQQKEMFKKLSRELREEK
jgi:hypothetical protein